MSEDPKKEKQSPKLKEELTEDELKGVSGGDGVVTDVPGNPLGSLKTELSDEELRGVTGGARYLNPDAWKIQVFHFHKERGGQE